MPKSYRIKAKPNEDKNIFVNLEQDFDQLEILSLKIVKSDVYSRTCADYGVIVGRAQANGGFGIPNAKVSVFIPITDEDAEDEVISQLYPFRQVTDKNEEGYRYNLLPKESESCNHTATGNFFTDKEVINNPVVLEVFEKYYKYTTKTNESGDYMLWGVPLGNQTIHTSIDVSDIGCYSMRPYQFIRQGASQSQFESSLEFKSSENLDTLPQIVLQNKAIQVVPFWGDEDLCGVGITRVDFDLRDSGVEITPSATFIGSIITDDDNNYVSVGGTPSKEQGQLCNLTTGTGTIESIRHTILKEDDGCTPKLEKFNLDNGGKVIDGNGTWVTQLPMNLDFIVTNEYGQKVISDDPKVGIPTRSKYRFRISFDGAGGEVRSGRYLVPNIREYTDPTQIDRSYSFSDTLMDYPEADTPTDVYGSPANKATDYFYEFLPNRVYSVANFIDNYRKNVNQGSNRTANSRWRFLGIKSINPSSENRCTDITKEFPANDVFRGGTTTFSTSQITRLLQVITLTIAASLISFQLLSFLAQFGSLCLRQVAATQLLATGFVAAASIIDIPVGSQLILNFTLDTIFGAIAIAFAGVFIYLPLGWSLVKNFYVVRKLYNYPNCEPCACGSTFKFNVYILINFLINDEDKVLQETVADDPGSVNDCNRERYMVGFDNGQTDDNAWYWQGKNNTFPRGCYVLQFRNGVYGTYIGGLTGLGITGLIPVIGPPFVWGIFAGAMTTLFILCLDSVYKMYRSLNQWRVLANIYTALCEGVFNMKFSNNWINGTLYFPKFITKKLKTNQTTGQPNTSASIEYDNKLVKLIEDDNGGYFYYRSCPFSPVQGFVHNSLVDGAQGLDAEHRGINFPTTIVELGPLDSCINEICKDEKTDNFECIFVDKLKPSSFQPSSELLGMLVERKIAAIGNYSEFVWSGVNKWFGADAKPGAAYERNNGNRRWGSDGTTQNPGPYRNRVIDGDIAQLIATNNQIGISVFTTDPDDPYYGQGTAWFNAYGGGFGFPYDPALQTSYLTPIATNFQLIPRNIDLINCVQGGNFGISRTQVVPYYAWNSSASYGTFNNDYDWTTTPLPIKGYQQGLTYPTPNPNNTTSWERPEYYGGDSSNPLHNLGYFDSIVTAQPSSPGGVFRLGTGMYFYFGLRQGASAYERFINEYLPPKDDTGEL
jgi:hypothetical protein